MTGRHTLLAIDGRPETLAYLAELGLTLPAGFTSRHATWDEVQRAVERLPGHALGPRVEAGVRAFQCVLLAGAEPVTTLSFAVDGDASRLAGTLGDPCLPLLRLLAEDLGPVVVLLSATEPLLLEAPKR